MDNLFLTKAFPHILAVEGVYSNDPADRGGETVFGISRKRHPNWEGWAIVDEIKKAGGDIEARIKANTGLMGMMQQFYYERFWLQVRAYEVHEDIGLELFDTAVNQGPESAVKYLQRALNKLNRNQADYKNIDDDGGFGFYTMEAYKAYMHTAHTIRGRSVPRNMKILRILMDYMQVDRYYRICDRDETQEKYMYGWLANRSTGIES